MSKQVKMMLLKGFSSLFFIILFLQFGFTQEICDNSIDDDNDGLIDLLDDDCNCSLNDPILPNFSFEDTLCCPFRFSQMECVSSWVQASDATSDFYHTCDFISYDGAYPRPVTPFPDGHGFTGFLNQTFLSIDGIEEAGKEYIGTCVNVPLRKDTLYRITFFIGFGDDDDSQNITSTKGKITLFGHSDCLGLPFEGKDCPLASSSSGWVELVTIPVEGRKEWKKVNATFVAPFDLEAIILGPDCSPLPLGEETCFFVDRVILDKDGLTFPFIDLTVTESTCKEPIQLSVLLIPDYTYQWYRNGIAIQAATNNVLDIDRTEENFASYQVTVGGAMGNCIRSSTFTYGGRELPIANLGRDTILCYNTSLAIGSFNNGLSYQWNTGETTQEIIINNSGTYRVTVTNECGEAIDEIEIMDGDNCRMEVPNVFTPNNDGINDSFGSFSNCVFKSYRLQVFNRLGQIVFETTNPSETWAGRIENTTQVSDVYIWTLAYSLDMSNGCYQDIRRMSGDVTLIR